MRSLTSEMYFSPPGQPGQPHCSNTFSRAQDTSSYFLPFHGLVGKWVKLVCLWSKIIKPILTSKATSFIINRNVQSGELKAIIEHYLFH